MAKKRDTGQAKYKPYIYDALVRLEDQSHVKRRYHGAQRIYPIVFEAMRQQLSKDDIERVYENGTPVWHVAILSALGEMKNEGLVEAGGKKGGWRFTYREELKANLKRQIEAAESWRAVLAKQTRVKEAELLKLRAELRACDVLG